jgi:DNA polymerase III subunit delta'
MKGKKTKQVRQPVLLPRENADIIGHDDVMADFLLAYNKGKMPCGWLLSGSKGIGKATMAYRMARFMLYHGAKKADVGFAAKTIATDLSIPQNSASFSKVAGLSHPDLLVLESGVEGLKSASGEILVDDARKIASFLHLTPSETMYRIVLIDSIDDMNPNAANSILKLLEEPPAKAMFLLVSHAPGRLLPTIRSRVRHVKMQKPDAANAYAIFNKIAPEVTIGEAEELLYLASGSPGGAYDLHINKGLEIYENIAEIINCLPRLDIAAIGKLADKISGKANEKLWHVFKLLLNKVVIDITRQKALGDAPYSRNIVPQRKLSIAIGADNLVGIWQEINILLEEADNVHLDRKALLMRVFGFLR